jgi:hypothetical protein
MAKIVSASEQTRLIVFQATPIVARDFGGYGMLGFNGSCYTLFVDRKVDFLWVKEQVRKA